MIKQTVVGICIFLLLNNSGFAATVLQVKGNSAILELSDTEIENLKPTAGQNIQILVNGSQAEGSIKKISKKKILIFTTADLSKEKNIKIENTNSNNSAKSTQRPSVKNPKNNLNSKKWTLGLNLKYALSGAAKITINSIPFNVKYSGLDLSGIGFYYWGNLGAGVEGEYAMFKGDDGTISYNVTQIQISLLGEYKFNDFSAGGLFTLASNYKSIDTAGNENSLNGMGFGVFATYKVIPSVRLIFDYRIVDYKLDPATIKTTDMRLGAGYYF